MIDISIFFLVNRQTIVRQMVRIASANMKKIFLDDIDQVINKWNFILSKPQMNNLKNHTDGLIID